MKTKIMAALLAMGMVMPLAGCANQGSPVQEESGRNPYYADNDIFTMEDLDDGRMVVVIDTQYNIPTANIEKVIEDRFPEVNVVLRLQNSPNTPYQTQKVLEHGLLGDLFFNTTGLSKDEDQLKKNFIDLSDAPFINNYYQNALDGVAVNGKIYMLPGFSSFMGIIYDRTLFEEQGWELPKSRDDFIALCGEIQERMGYQAFMPTMLYARMAMLLSHAFHYEQVIAGAENQRWLRDYRANEESFSGHMEPLFEGMKELFDAGVLTEENFEVRANVRSIMLYKEHTAAMTMETQNAVTYAANAESDHEYGMMPFWNGNDADSDYLVSEPGFRIYANKELEKPENAAKLDKVMEILAYLSTPEGQRALMSQETAAISNVKNTGSFSGGDFMKGVSDTIAKGNIFDEVRYTDLPNNNPFQVAFREALMGYIDGTMSMEAAMAHCDKALWDVLNEKPAQEPVYGRATENFTILETCGFVADVLREKADADIGLVLAQQLAYGEAVNFFEGDITDTVLEFVMLDYVTGRNPDYNRLVTVDLTGAQIFEIINYPYFNRDSTDDPGAWVASDNPQYWVPSNLKVEYAPLLPENRLLSLKNMDGSPFDLEKTYRVAVWNGCFSNMNVTDYFDKGTIAAMEKVTSVTDATSTELIKAAVTQAGEISPPEDGRFTIRWDVKAGTAPAE